MLACSVGALLVFFIVAWVNVLSDCLLSITQRVSEDERSTGCPWLFV